MTHQDADNTTRVRVSREPLPVEMHLSRRHRIRLVVEGALVGIVVGIVITAYRFMLSHAEELMRAITTWLRGGGVLFLLWFVVLLALCFIVSLLMLREPYTQGSGIPQIDSEVEGRIDMPWWRVIPIKFAEGVLCAFAGLSLGREGPSVQLGGMAAKGVSHALENERTHERLLITCGAAAGMASAFHAPLTGVLFAVEEIHRSFSVPLVISVMTACVFSDYVSSQIMGVSPVIPLIVYEQLPHSMYMAVVAMGVICGVAGWLHNAGMFAIQERLYGPLERLAPRVRLVIPFVLAGFVALFWPDLLCGGDAIIERVLHVQAETAMSLALLLVGKYVFTALCFGSGAPGGTLFPLVVFGMLIGALYGFGILAVVGLPSSFENSFIVLGIAGLFSAVIQAPVTAVVLVFELTGSLSAMLATSVVSIVAYVTTALLKNDAFYQHLLARMHGQNIKEFRKGSPRGQKIIRNYVVGAGSLVEGHHISEVAWPPDTLVVTVRQSGQKVIPKGDTPLVALSEISILMDEADELTCDEQLRALCASRD